MSQAKDAYTTQDLAPVLGCPVRTVNRRAKREGWTSRPRKGRGGGNEWLLSSMPKSTRKALLDGMLRTAAQEAEKNLPALPPLDAADPRRAIAARMSPLKHCSNRQREIAMARLALIREVERLAVLTGVDAAIMKLVQDAADGTLPAHLMRAVRDANDRFGSGDKRGLSRRRLYAWRTLYIKGGEDALVPKHKAKDMTVPEWAEAFLAFFRLPQKPSLTQAHRDLCRAYADGTLTGTPPSIHAVKRWAAKVALPELERGRRTGNALLKLQPHKRRSTKDMLPGDCYTADGTTFDAEIRNPHNGQPFKPEVTIVLDVATRRCVGISLNYAENAQGVLDALRMACLFGGIPAMFYSDNGPGYDNLLLTAPGTGMLARLGIERAASIPGRPQGKGLMERAVPTFCDPVAKRFATCTHRDMDADAAKKVYKITREALKRGARTALMPTWDEFKTAMLERVAEYNATPHRALPMTTDASGKRRHMSPDEAWQHFLSTGWEPVHVPADCSNDFFMPAERRIVRNGEVRFGGGIYYADDLAPHHGDAVMVRYDVWDASRVYVWTMDGHKICDAVLDGNSIPYFQQTRIEAARAQREAAQLKRLEAKANRIAPGATLVLPEAERPHVITLVADSLAPREPLPARADESAAPTPTPDTAQPVTLDVAPLRAPAPEQQPRPCFAHGHERYEWLMRHKDRWLDKDEPWLCRYVETFEYADSHDRYVHEGIAWPGWKALAHTEN